jgi:hypothetical protein
LQEWDDMIPRSESASVPLTSTTSIPSTSTSDRRSTPDGFDGDGRRMRRELLEAFLADDGDGDTEMGAIVSAPTPRGYRLVYSDELYAMDDEH